ncbi:MAG: M15 family metallopeptidase [Eggerthellaceae bacterium]|nr:M15 family metallopeptidase [Eggerthellaceae bacterium]
MNETTMLVNESHPLPLNWQPDDLVDLWKVQPRHYLLYPRPTRLSECAADAANGLFEQAEREGFDDFMVLSAFRDSDYQAGLFADSPNGYVARPGCSEHQTGLAMDIAQFGRGMALDDAHAAWLTENCWEHGFIVRYPEGREDVTGIPAEPWHLRYVGRDAAMEMRERGWVLEEWHGAHGMV